MAFRYEIPSFHRPRYHRKNDLFSFCDADFDRIASQRRMRDNLEESDGVNQYVSFNLAIGELLLREYWSIGKVEKDQNANLIDAMEVLSFSDEQQKSFYEECESPATTIILEDYLTIDDASEYADTPSLRSRRPSSVFATTGIESPRRRIADRIHKVMDRVSELASPKSRPSTKQSPVRPTFAESFRESLASAVSAAASQRDSLLDHYIEF